MKNKFSINKFFLKVAFVFISCLVLFFTLPFLLNLNSFKNNLEIELTSILGSHVKIDGDIVYSIKTGPKLKLDNVVFENEVNEGLSGNINEIEFFINPIDFLTQDFNFKKINLINGSLSVPELFVYGFYNYNKSQLEEISFHNVDFKIFNEQSEFQIDSNSGIFIFNNNKLTSSKFYGLISNLDYEIKFKNNVIDFSIPQIKFALEFLLPKQPEQNNFLQIKSASNIFFPGFNNIYLRSGVQLGTDKIILNNIKLTSAIYNGLGNIEIYLKPNLLFKTDLVFGRTNFSSISSSVLSDFLSNDILDIASNFNAHFKIKFKHLIIDQAYFDDLNIDIKFVGGDIILNNVEFISANNNFLLTGRIVEDNKDKLMFFKSKFSTNQLKKMCLKTCKSYPLSNDYVMVAQGTFNLKKAKFYLEEFFSNKNYNKEELELLTNRLNSIIAGNISKSLELKSYLSIY